MDVIPYLIILSGPSTLNISPRLAVLLSRLGPHRIYFFDDWEKRPGRPTLIHTLIVFDFSDESFDLLHRFYLAEKYVLNRIYFVSSKHELSYPNFELLKHAHLQFEGLVVEMFPERNFSNSKFYFKLIRFVYRKLSLNQIVTIKELNTQFHLDHSGVYSTIHGRRVSTISFDFQDFVSIGPGEFSQLFLNPSDYDTWLAHRRSNVIDETVWLKGRSYRIAREDDAYSVSREDGSYMARRHDGYWKRYDEKTEDSKEENAETASLKPVKPNANRDHNQKDLADSTIRKVFFGTNRLPREGKYGEIVFSDEREESLHYGICSVRIPRSHRIGSVGSSWFKRLFMRHDDRLKLDGVEVLTIEQFENAVRRCVKDLRKHPKSGVVFLHGYNVTFADAAIRAAQLAVDLQIKGPMSFFSWASKGGVIDYQADEATIEVSEVDIHQFIEDFATRSGLESVHIIAHSMGNRALLRIVDKIIQNADRIKKVNFGHIILAAPDVDTRLFRKLAVAYSHVAMKTTLYVSNKDKALSTSGYLHQFPRAGISPPVVVVPPIDTILAGDVDLSFLGHGYIAESREVLTDIHAILHNSSEPSDRIGLEEVRTQANEKYWVIKR